MSNSHPSATPTPPGNSPSLVPSSPTPTPTPPAALPLGIVVKDFLVEGGSTYTVSLVALDGHVVATATGAKRTRPPGVYVQMPNVSASNSRLYYLDGSSKVMFLKTDGTTGAATTIAVDANSAAVFSVSPDDSRIAVAVITFPYPAKTRIYVEDLSGGGHHVDLFSSTTVIEWPVGWDQGHLVIGVGTNVHPQNAYEGFLFADHGYHVADAGTGARLATVCDGYLVSDPPVPAGTVCSNFPNNLVADWSGASRPAPADDGCGGGALSTDGAIIADCQSNPRIVILTLHDGTRITTTAAATPVGWIDATHLVVRQNSDNSLAILDTRSMGLTPIQTSGFFAGAIPGAL